jgi:hypothetical protein
MWRWVSSRSSAGAADRVAVGVLVSLRALRPGAATDLPAVLRVPFVDTRLPMVAVVELRPGCCCSRRGTRPRPRTGDDRGESPRPPLLSCFASASHSYLCASLVDVDGAHTGRPRLRPQRRPGAPPARPGCRAGPSQPPRLPQNFAGCRPTIVAATSPTVSPPFPPSLLLSPSPAQGDAVRKINHVVLESVKRMCVCVSCR